MANGLTDDGFNVESFSTNLSDLVSDIQDAFNNTSIAADDNTYIGQLLKVLAARETKAWQAIYQTYTIWTRNGAEGSFLDELFALQGVFRESATSGVGDCIVELDDTSLDSTVIEAGTEFEATNSITYTNTTEQTANSRVVAWKVDGAEAALATYSVEITDSDDNVNSTTFTLAATDDTSRLTFITDIQEWLTDNYDGETSYLQLDSDNLILYWGFDAAYALKGLSSEYTLSMSGTTLGTRYVAVEATAETTGYYPLAAGGISAMSPLPTGYISVTNITAFASGEDVETDAAFVERARNAVDSPRSSTRTAIRAALLSNVPDIERVYLNKYVTDGQVYCEWIIVGGETADIADVLYNTNPINNNYTGDVAYSVDTEDGDTETMRFTRGEELPMYVQVTYTTKKGTALTDSEKTAITTAMTDLAEDWGLGGSIIFMSQLASCVYSGGSSTSRFTSVSVAVTDTSGGTYASTDYTADVAQYPTLDADNITFVQG